MTLKKPVPRMNEPERDTLKDAYDEYEPTKLQRGEYDSQPIGKADELSKKTSGISQFDPVTKIQSTKCVCPDPLPLLSKIDPESYPFDALPSTLQEAVQEVLDFVQAPIPLVANSALAAISLASQAHIDVKRAEKLFGPTGLFLLTIADSGERKSSCDGFFMQAIRDYAALEAEAAKPLINDHRAALEAWEAKHSGTKRKIQGLVKSGENGEIGEQEEALRILEHEKPEPPRVPKFIYTDITPEELKWKLATKWPSSGVVSSEGGLIFGSHGMGKDSVMRNLATLNQLWDGADISTDRRTSESFTVHGARLTVAIQIQDATLRSFLNQSGTLARGSGFLARFLIAWPESTQGYRKFTEAPNSWPALAKFNRRIENILEKEPTFDEEGILTPHEMNLSTEAKDAWIIFHDSIEGELKSGGELYDVRDVASKTADNAVRIAALFQFFENGIDGEIGIEAFEGASRVAAWHLHEARRFFNELALPEEQANVVALNRWLIDYCKREKTSIISRRDVQRNVTPVRLRQKVAFEAAIHELIKSYRVRIFKFGKQKEIHINPKLLIDDMK